MAKARALDRRRKSVRNIRKITRTMELIATARFKKAMDRSMAVAAYTRRITAMVHDLTHAGLEVTHPLLEPREEIDNATLLVLNANRGLCAGYNTNVLRLAFARWDELKRTVKHDRLEVSGKRGFGPFCFRGITPDETFTHFEDKPTFEEVDVLAHRYLEMYKASTLDRLDVVYTQFESLGRFRAVVETLLPVGGLHDPDEEEEPHQREEPFEFFPSAESILDEIVPTSFRMRLFKCFLDAAASEQVSRMMAMKAATENADAMIDQLSMSYNRARQGQITAELLEIIGGADALEK
jgi:F-type H+-transporting ATPase subunit gamma